MVRPLLKEAVDRLAEAKNGDPVNQACLPDVSSFRDFLMSEETVFRGFSNLFRILSGISGI